MLYIWVLTAAFSASFSWYWDIYKDWGLGNKDHKYLRDVKTYRKEFYYFAIVSNGFFRCLWTLSISPATMAKLMDPFWVSTIIAICEVLRRAQWNLLRVENEHLNNVGKMKVLDITIPSLTVQTPQIVHLP